MRSSVNAAQVNQPRLLMGVDWFLALAIIIFFGFGTFVTRNFWLPLIGMVLVTFMMGASKSDPMFLKVYIRHAKCANRYSPAPVVRTQVVNRRPARYGRYDPN